VKSFPPVFPPPLAPHGGFGGAVPVFPAISNFRHDYFGFSWCWWPGYWFNW